LVFYKAESENYYRTANRPSNSAAATAAVGDSEFTCVVREDKWMS